VERQQQLTYFRALPVFPYEWRHDIERWIMDEFSPARERKVFLGAADRAMQNLMRAFFGLPQRFAWALKSRYLPRHVLTRAVETELVHVRNFLKQHKLPPPSVGGASATENVEPLRRGSVASSLLSPLSKAGSDSALLAIGSPTSAASPGEQLQAEPGAPSPSAETVAALPPTPGADSTPGADADSAPGAAVTPGNDAMAGGQPETAIAAAAAAVSAEGATTAGEEDGSQPALVRMNSFEQWEAEPDEIEGETEMPPLDDERALLLLSDVLEWRGTPNRVRLPLCRAPLRQ
jgi:hypothetical protein